MGALRSDELEVQRAVRILADLEATKLDALSLGRPRSAQHAASLARVIGKLSPMVSDLLEVEFAEHLNSQPGWPAGHRWVSQDPGFPDLVLRCEEPDHEHAGIEIKTWFALGTEVTGRFRQSQSSLVTSETRLMVVAWLPEFILHGRPLTLGVWVDKALNVARVRDSKYHRPPQYLVLEPETVSTRVGHAQNHSVGYFFRGSPEEFEKAKADIDSSVGALTFTSSKYQNRLRELVKKHPYALDTNFAKFDRLEHESLREFKRHMLSKILHGRSVEEWREGVLAGADGILDDITRLGGAATLPR